MSCGPNKTALLPRLEHPRACGTRLLLRAVTRAAIRNDHLHTCIVERRAHHLVYRVGFVEGRYHNGQETLAVEGFSGRQRWTGWRWRSKRTTKPAPGGGEAVIEQVPCDE